MFEFSYTKHVEEEFGQWNLISIGGSLKPQEGEEIFWIAVWRLYFGITKGGE